MSDEVWKRAEVESPCVKICVIHPAARICVGCFRSIDEIAGWGGMTAQRRAEIMADLPSRASGLTKRRGGRMGRMAD